MKMSALEASRVVPPPARCVPRQAWRNGTTQLGERTLAEEVPVAFSYGGATHAVLMATPDDLEDFALGFSYTEGIITAPTEIAELTVVSVLLTESCCECGWPAIDPMRSRQGAVALLDRPGAACVDWRVWPKPTVQYRRRIMTCR